MDGGDWLAKLPLMTRITPLTHADPIRWTWYRIIWQYDIHSQPTG